MNSRVKFDGKVVIITGASQGIGRATALAFARKGAIPIWYLAPKRNWTKRPTAFGVLIPRCG